MRSKFNDLVAYRLAVELADDLQRDIAAWPRFEQWSLGMQLTRAADSIGANIAEATGRWHRADKRRLFIIARGSTYETEHWVNRAAARGLRAADANERLGEIARTLNGLINRPF